MIRLATFSMLIFFSGILTGNSMLMYSIENGNVFTEKLKLSHILKSPFSAPHSISQHCGVNSIGHLNHRHIQSATIAIPEKKTLPCRAKSLYSGQDSQVLSQDFSIVSQAIISLYQVNSTAILKMPISPLYQVSVLLI